MIMADRKALVAHLVAGIGPSSRAAERPGATNPAGFSVPAERPERERLRRAAREYVAARRLTPPLPLDSLLRHSGCALALAGAGDAYRSFMAVLVSNEIWRDEVAATPFERRIFLLPQCLRSLTHCRGEFDELGLLCAGCGACPIGQLEEEAEELGYIVLVAEGTTIACRLLEMGLVDAVMGVSCLSVLERAFAPMSEDAIPGIAIPLLRDGCQSTAVDVAQVREALALSAPPKAARLDIETLRDEVASWFETAALEEVLGEVEGRTAEIALSWLSRGGKRWRPFLALCVAEALGGPTVDRHMLRMLAVAVECFHKASLVHDDIEDGDLDRYDGESLHAEWGVPVALNVGDLLLGEGYRLIARCGAAPEKVARMLAIAAEGHRTLCTGQGEELCLRRERTAFSPEKALEIFRCKTAPAFEVAMRLAATAVGADVGIHAVLHEFCEALGVAYQVRDDIDDFAEDAARVRDPRWTPSLVFATANRRASERQRDELSQLRLTSGSPRRLRELINSTGALRSACALMESYRAQAVQALQPLENVEIKTLLQRCIGRILGPALRCADIPDGTAP